MPKADSINRFLKESRENFDPSQATTVVMGNRSADLDSIVSALTLAYYLSNKGAPAMICLINIPRSHFASRTEVVLLFGDLGIDTDLLFFREDIDLDMLSNRGNLRLVLVDHNEMDPDQADLKDSVVRILDHHEDKKDYPEGCIVDIRFGLGSTATLVTELYLEDGQELIDEAVGTLLFGTILLDTLNFNPKNSKDKDKQAADALQKIDASRLYERLQTEKFNVANLNTLDLLRRDPKIYPLGAKRLGISSIFLSIADWIERDPDLVSGFKSYYKEERLDGLITMHAIQGPKFSRNLGVYIPDETRRKKAVAFLETSADLQLERIPEQLIKTVKDPKREADFFFQGNPGLKRKLLEEKLPQDFLG